MRKALTFSILTLTIVAMVAAFAFAAGDKCTKTDKTAVKSASSVSTATSCDSDGELMKKAEADGEWTVKTISVKGMTCTGCEETLKAELAKVPGVMEIVKVCHKSEEAVVKVDPTKAQDLQLTKAIIDKGYKAEIIPAVAKTATKAKGPVCPMSGGPGCDAMKAAGGDCQKVHSAKADKKDSKEKSKETSDDIH